MGVIEQSSLPPPRRKLTFPRVVVPWTTVAQAPTAVRFPRMWLSELAAHPKSVEQPSSATARRFTHTSPLTLSLAAVTALKNAPRLTTRSWRTVTVPELASVHEPAITSDR